MADFQTLQEIAQAARAALGQGPWDYLTGGGETETTLKRNRVALDSLALRPRILSDVRGIDCTTEMLGRRWRLPVILAPMGSLQVFHPGGALAVAKAAEAFGALLFLSSLTKPEIEDIAREIRQPLVYQIYVRGDDEWVAGYVQRARDAGCLAVCFTVDIAIYGRRERDLMKRYRPPTRNQGDPAGFVHQTAWNWDNIRRFKDRHDIPLIVKGIATAEDAEIAVAHGVDVVYVSNHGGRQLDHGRGAIEVLPEVVGAVGGRAKVMIDGGFMRGTDILKAIALGADAVGLGKLVGLGLAAAGEAGVARVLEILELEMTTAMRILGATRLAELGAGCVQAAPPVTAPSLLGPYPHVRVPELGY